MDTRRVMAGFDPTGGDTVTADEPIGDGMTMPDLPGWEMAVVASTSPDVVLPAANSDALDVGVPPGATQFLFWRLPPVEKGPNPGGMHRTDTVDYVVVLSGGVTMVMGDGTEIDLRQGDCVVQHGGLHEWVNRSGDDCVMAVFLVGARRG